MKFKKAMVPSLFTLFNLLAGFWAIVSIFDGQYQRAVWLIFFAGVFDGLDGKLARFIGSSSDFGIELDSMADVVSFCAAPSLLIYRLYTMDLGALGVLIAFFPLMFGAIRLARYNVQTTDNPLPYFIGLPTPVNAVAIASFPLFYFSWNGTAGNSSVFLPYMICLSFLMVSHIPYAKLPRFSLEMDVPNLLKLSGMVASIVALILFPAKAMLLLSLLFVLSGILRWMAGTEQEDDDILEPITK
ncbi:MAG: CDP-diacylglycerol--serine O-phosphatidyltransferase [Candidatus Marinimicrobia bacterium]|nr:CDP-diacylglycerol--serine O-phosphatidyltransferase [Candidatus Neomarinimicrobiota bacterium]